MSRIQFVRSYELPPVRRSRARVVPVDFRGLSRSAGVFTNVPAWLPISCATTNRTVQTSASSLVSGIGANAFRAMSVDGAAFGLPLESSSTQQNPHTDLTNVAWSAVNGATITAATDPTGASSSCSVNDPNGSAVAQLVQTITTLAGQTCISVWMQILAPSPTRCDVQSNTGAGDILISSTVDAAWIRRDVTGIATGAAHNSAIVPRNVVASETGSVLIYGYQIESGKYPKSVFLNTSGSSTTRAADVSAPTGSVVMPDGYPTVSMIYAPHYASTEQGVDHNWIYIDANNRLFMQQSTSKLIWRVAGVDVASAALTWSRYQAITVTAQHSPRYGRRLTVNGVASTPGSASSAMTVPATVGIGGGASGPEESGSLLALGFYRDAA